MRTREFTRLLHQLQSLTITQKQELKEMLSHHDEGDKVCEVIDDVHHCPYCKSETVHKWGMRSGLQRYRCKSCHKTFNALTGTPLARLRHKEEWMYYAEELREGKSIRASADRCHIHPSTSFRWRHRMLQTARQTVPKALNGIIEFDETYFLESHKGEKHLQEPRKRGGKAFQRGISSSQTDVLIIRDRSGHIVDAILETSNKETLAQIIIPHVQNDALLCSDSKPAYKAFAKKYGCTLETINLSQNKRTNGIVHVQNVNAYTSRLKSWMKRFHGVATKYLESYLAWMRLLDAHKNITPEALLALSSRPGMICQPLVRT